MQNKLRHIQCVIFKPFKSPKIELTVNYSIFVWLFVKQYLMKYFNAYRILTLVFRSTKNNPETLISKNFVLLLSFELINILRFRIILFGLFAFSILHVILAIARIWSNCLYTENIEYLHKQIRCDKRNFLLETKEGAKDKTFIYPDNYLLNWQFVNCIHASNSKQYRCKCIQRHHLMCLSFENSIRSSF